MAVTYCPSCQRCWLTSPPSLWTWGCCQTCSVPRSPPPGPWTDGGPRTPRSLAHGHWTPPWPRRSGRTSAGWGTSLSGHEAWTGSDCSHLQWTLTSTVRIKNSLNLQTSYSLAKWQNNISILENGKIISVSQKILVSKWNISLKCTMHIFTRQNLSNTNLFYCRV